MFGKRHPTQRRHVCNSVFVMLLAVTLCCAAWGGEQFLLHEGSVDNVGTAWGRHSNGWHSNGWRMFGGSMHELHLKTSLLGVPRMSASNVKCAVYFQMSASVMKSAGRSTMKWLWSYWHWQQLYGVFSASPWQGNVTYISGILYISIGCLRMPLQLLLLFCFLWVCMSDTISFFSRVACQIRSVTTYFHSPSLLYKRMPLLAHVGSWVQRYHDSYPYQRGVWECARRLNFLGGAQLWKQVWSAPSSFRVHQASPGSMSPLAQERLLSWMRCSWRKAFPWQRWLLTLWCKQAVCMYVSTTSGAFKLCSCFWLLSFNIIALWAFVMLPLWSKSKIYLYRNSIYRRIFFACSGDPPRVMIVMSSNLLVLD